jgi:biopolymer transport protein TolR
MVTAPLSIGGIHVDLPVSKARSTSVDERKIILSINGRGEFFIDKLEIKPAMLGDKLKAIFDAQVKKELYIRADRGVVYGRVVDAMSAAKLAGVTRMSMLTQPPAKG